MYTYYHTVQVYVGLKYLYVCRLDLFGHTSYVLTCTRTIHVLVKVALIAIGSKVMVI